MKYLLDTNICVHLMNRTRPDLTRRVLSHHPDDIGVSVITASELSYGVQKSRRRAEAAAALARLLTGVRVLSFEQSAVEAYGRIRAELESRGLPIGPLDTLIAAHAQALRVVVVTNNMREFSRVRDLIVEDWTV